MSMDGNPHYPIASSRLRETPEPRSRTAEQIHFTLDALTQSTLALAYEHRTANLIALHQMAVTAIQNGADNDGISPDDFRRSSDEIEARLGLNGGTK